jgi:putative transposase
LCGSPEVLKENTNYTHQNPVRAGFVEKAEDWICRSAGDYILNRGGLVEIVFA